MVLVSANTLAVCAKRQSRRRDALREAALLVDREADPAPTDALDNDVVAAVTTGRNDLILEDAVVILHDLRNCVGAHPDDVVV
jgi:hypothetical protein